MNEQGEIARLRAELEHFETSWATAVREKHEMMARRDNAQSVRDELLLQNGRLTAELAQARKATEEAQSEAAARLKQTLEQVRLCNEAIKEWRKSNAAFEESNRELAAELRRAVDALRESQILGQRMRGFVKVFGLSDDGRDSDYDKYQRCIEEVKTLKAVADDIVAAYDAKHGEKI